ncbi:MAG: phosphoglucosamine mutase, partial [Actinomycetota bacterium]
VELTPEFVMSLGRAAAAVFRSSSGSERPAVLTVRDTRASGDLLESALAAGLLSAGSDVFTCGVLPTPAAAFLVADVGAVAGAVISASHNPAEDNGIKFFGPDGFKLTDAQEEQIEKLLDEPPEVLWGGEVGRIAGLPDAEDRYVEHALRALEGRRLDGMRVVVDCAHGAAFRTSPRALEEAGAEVIVLNAEPNGANINVRCGSTSPRAAAEAVLAHGADAGLAHDGDADRVIAVDERGQVVDGDAMIAALALELKEQGRLCGDLVVSTVMANLGLRLALVEAGIRLIESPVGDRFVIEAMRAHGAVLGGEQSGHLIFADLGTTGDGLVTGLRLLGRMASTGRRLSELVGIVERFPQVLINVAVGERDRLGEAERVWQAVEEAGIRLGEGGRVLVRPSGTEPLVRVMVEASDEITANSVAEEIASVVEKELGREAGRAAH